MPNSCVAFGCTSGYKSSKEAKKRLFQFPSEKKNPELRAKWLRVLRLSSDYKIEKWTCVCEDHFRPYDIETHRNDKNKTRAQNIEY